MKRETWVLLISLLVTSAAVLLTFKAEDPSYFLLFGLALVPLFAAVPNLAIFYLIVDAWNLDRFSFSVAPFISGASFAVLAWFIQKGSQLELPKLPFRVLFRAPMLAAGSLVGFATLSSVLHGNGLDFRILNNLIFAGFFALVLACPFNISLLPKAATFGGFLLAIAGFLQLAIDGIPPEGLTGFFPNHVQFGFFILLSVPFILVFLESAQGPLKWSLALILIFNLAMMILSKSRGTVVVFVVCFAGAVLFKLRPKHGVAWYSIIVLIIGLLICISLVSWQTKSLDSVDEKELNTFMRGRVSFISAAWNMFSESPFWGVGYGTYRKQWSAYSDVSHLGGTTRESERAAHSTYMQVLAELGIFGGLFFVSVIVSSLVSIVRLIRRSSGLPFFHRRVALAALTTLIFFSLHGTLDNSGLQDRPFFLLVGLACGLPHYFRFHAAAPKGQ